jgi:hypothetical protein
MIKDLWYKNAVIYCLSIGTYMDANGDGIGDFQGLMRRLDYLHGLGVTAIWLMPFQTSPGRDDGYDVSDYYGVNPAYGTLGDFVEFTHSPSATASARPKSPSRASSRSFCTACGSTKPSSTGRRRRLPFSEHNGIAEFLPHGGKRRPSRDDGDGKFDRFCARVRMDDRDCNIEPPASPYAIMRRAHP